MKKLTRRQFTAAGILAAMGAAAAFIPSCNNPASVYGPPPDDYDPDDNVVETVYGPPDDYDPDNNEIVDVYGPPDDFDPDNYSGWISYTELTDVANEGFHTESQQ